MQVLKPLKLLALMLWTILSVAPVVYGLPVDHAIVQEKSPLNPYKQATTTAAQVELSDTFTELQECMESAGADINKRLDCLLEFLNTEGLFRPGYSDIEVWIEEHRQEIVDCWNQAVGDEMKFLDCFLHLIQIGPDEIRFIETIAAMLLGDGVATEDIKNRIRGIMIDPNISPGARCTVLALLLIEIEKEFPGSSLEQFLRIKVAQACGDVDGIGVSDY